MKILDQPYYTFDDVLIQPKYSNIYSRDNIDTSVTFLGMRLYTPIISSNMDYVTGPIMAKAMYRNGGLGILHRFTSWENLKKDILEVGTSIPPVAFSVGTRDSQDSLDRIRWVNTNADLKLNLKIICIDVAHGHHVKVSNLIKDIKDHYPDNKIIAGNVATAAGAAMLVEAGADAIKIGIGPGSVCTTRIVTGVGVPQLSAILEIASIVQEFEANLIADGGIKTSGDIVKALGAGATVVMLGNLLAGTMECPGEVIETGDGRRLRRFRGQSIFGVNGEKFVKEGVSGYVEEKGSVSTVLAQLTGGLRSGMSYVGALNLKELREKTTFIPVTSSSLIESNHRMGNNVT